MTIQITALNNITKQRYNYITDTNKQVSSSEDYLKGIISKGASYVGFKEESLWFEQIYAELLINGFYSIDSEIGTLTITIL